MKKLLIAGVAAVAIATAAAQPARANPVLVTAPAWVVVTVAGILVVGMVAAAATARAKHCHWALVRNVNGTSDSVYICDQ